MLNIEVAQGKLVLKLEQKFFIVSLNFFAKIDANTSFLYIKLNILVMTVPDCFNKNTVLGPYLDTF